ncbi:MAG: hypothetical protein ACRC4J_00810 [Cetobacterium sp.]
MTLASRSRIQQSKSQTTQLKIIPFVPNPGGQTEFWDLVHTEHEYKTIYLKGGIGAGKTNTGAAWFCERRRLDPTARSLITSNSYPQLERSTLVGLAEHCERHGIPLLPWGDRPEETGLMIARRRHCRIWGSFVYVVSADNFVGGAETGRGMQVRDIWYDEGAYGEAGAFETLSGRFPRGPGTLKGYGVITSSINKNDPFNYLYDLFDAPDRSPDKIRLYKSIKCAATENPYLDKDYVPSLLAQMSPQMAQLEIYSEYVLLDAKRVYPDFDRTLNGCNSVTEGDETLHIGVDFNIGIMAAIVVVIRDGLPHVVAELSGDRDTPTLIASIKARYIQHPIIVYPDASGEARSTNAALSDIALIKQAGLAVKCKDSNPPVKDRVASVNAMILNALGDRRLKVNIANCPMLTKALEKQQYDDKGKPDKTNGLDHYEEALGYVSTTLYPVAAPSGYKPVKR